MPRIVTTFVLIATLLELVFVVRHPRFVLSTVVILLARVAMRLEREFTRFTDLRAAVCAFLRTASAPTSQAVPRACTREEPVRKDRPYVCGPKGPALRSSRGLYRSRASQASKTAIHDEVGEFGYPDANACPPS